MDDVEGATDCPFCGFRPETHYAMLVHMEERHPENGESPFVAQEAASVVSAVSSEEEQAFAECPVEGCNEMITLAELDDHIELHGIEDEQLQPHDVQESSADGEGGGSNGYQSPYGSQGTPNKGGSSSRNHSDRRVDSKNHKSGSVHKWKQLLSMPAGVKKRDTSSSTTVGQRTRKRLGKAELGRYAHEDAMPDWLIRLLREKGQVIQGGVISVLARILQQSSTTRHAYLCHEAVDHVSKLKREGGFCGYRNIQMLCSYIIGTRDVGAAHFNGRLPSIFKIQNLIEGAWDMGINVQGRVETGGVKGTRKYIGTPEAQAVFTSLDIPCDAQGFKDQYPGHAEARLLKHIQDYFESDLSTSPDSTAKIRRTCLPPIYFQHRGHSMTIVGLEKRTDGTTDLLVFDPMFRDAEVIARAAASRSRVALKIKSLDEKLKLYRRGNKYLKRFHEFEILKLKSRLPATLGDDEDVAEAS